MSGGLRVVDPGSVDAFCVECKREVIVNVDTLTCTSCARHVTRPWTR